MSTPFTKNQQQTTDNTLSETKPRRKNTSSSAAVQDLADAPENSSEYIPTASNTRKASEYSQAASDSIESLMFQNTFKGYKMASSTPQSVESGAMSVEGFYDVVAPSYTSKNFVGWF